MLQVTRPMQGARLPAPALESPCRGPGKVGSHQSGCKPPSPQTQLERNAVPPPLNLEHDRNIFLWEFLPTRASRECNVPSA